MLDYFQQVINNKLKRLQLVEMITLVCKMCTAFIKLHYRSLVGGAFKLFLILSNTLASQESEPWSASYSVTACVNLSTSFVSAACNKSWSKRTCEFVVWESNGTTTHFHETAFKPCWEPRIKFFVFLDCSFCPHQILMTYNHKLRTKYLCVECHTAVARWHRPALRK